MIAIFFVPDCFVAWQNKIFNSLGDPGHEDFYNTTRDTDI